MPINEICNREVIIVRRDETVMQAAKLMRQHHVGTVVVIEERNEHRVPVGIITDRDLVVGIIATEIDSNLITVGDLIADELVTVKERCGVYEAIQYMRSKGVRRLPVVDDEGGLIGLVTLDDLLALLADEIAALAVLVEHEQKNEARRRS